MNKETIIDIEQLTQDAHNFNKGTDEGHEMMERSFREHGAGRSVLIDKNGNIIAGNKSQKAAIAAGIKKVRVIETDGSELVAVKRTDVDIDSKEGRELAMLDNLTQEVSLTWDKAELFNVAEQIQGFDPEEWGFGDIAEQLEDEQFERDFNSINNDNAKYPLIPKYDEKHELFVIVSSNEVDSNYLREMLNMQKMKSYKTGKYVKSNVIDIKDVIHELKNSHTKSQAPRQGFIEEAAD